MANRRGQTGGTKPNEEVSVPALLDRLSKHALGDANLNATQIRAIELLLRQAAAAEEDRQPIPIRIERVTIDPPKWDE